MNEVTIHHELRETHQKMDRSNHLEIYLMENLECRD